MSGWRAKLCRGVRAFAGDARGVIAVKFAFVVPPLAMLSLGAVDLHAVHATKMRLQDTADAAALAGANELGLAVDENGPEARANDWIDVELEKWADAPPLERDIDVVDLPDGGRALRVLLTGRRTSFFGNLLPPGGWVLRANATATTVAMTPLCVLGFNETKNDVIRVKDQSKINAPACLVHSNADIKADGGTITAAAVSSVEEAHGSISPDPSEGAAPIDDPFRSLGLSQVKSCLGALVLVKLETGHHVFPPGVHCGGFEVYKDASLTLLPGEHWFLGGNLIVKEDATLHGDNVVLFFDKASKFEFKDRSRVTLDGRKSGPYAGFVMVGMRDNTQDFVISSDNVESLLGVLYVPRARLIVEGKAEVAKESAWTVIVADQLELKGSPSLFINANYDASDVPVPDGVGPRMGGGRLID